MITFIDNEPLKPEREITAADHLQNNNQLEPIETEFFVDTASYIEPDVEDVEESDVDEESNVDSEDSDIDLFPWDHETLLNGLPDYFIDIHPVFLDDNSDLDECNNSDVYSHTDSLSSSSDDSFLDHFKMNVLGSNSAEESSENESEFENETGNENETEANEPSEYEAAEEKENSEEDVVVNETSDDDYLNDETSENDAANSEPWDDELESNSMLYNKEDAMESNESWEDCSLASANDIDTWQESSSEDN